VRIINSYPSKVFISHIHVVIYIHLTHQAEECMCGATPTQLFFLELYAYTCNCRSLK
jgi:hypothetical protein